MSGENWESLITEKGFMRVPRALRLKRAELGITNNEYTILLDYVDYYSFSGTMNPYGHLSEVSGMNERSIRRVLTSLEKKGLLKRKVSLHGNGRTKGVVFSIDPLVRKLRIIMKEMSPTVGEENVPYVHEESVPPNTGEDLNKRDESKNTSAKNADGRKRAYDGVRVNEEAKEVSETGEINYGFIRETGGPDQEAPGNDRRQAREGDAETKEGKAGQIHLARAGQGPRGPITGEDEEPVRKEKKKSDPCSPSRWYNEVFRGLYEEAAGQPALTGGREYKSAEMYFRRLRELNPEMEPGEIYELAGEGAAFMMGSQMEGGVFGWMHKPPDICLLSSQAQSVEWHLRKMRRAIPQPGPSTLRRSSGQAGSGRTDCASLTAGSGGGTNESFMNTDSAHQDELLNENKVPPHPNDSDSDIIDPDLSTLPASIAGATDSSLARNRFPRRGEGNKSLGRADAGSVADSNEGGSKGPYTSAGSARFIEKIREGHYASEQIERVYGELRGIESASRGRALPAGNRALRRKRG